MTQLIPDPWRPPLRQSDLIRPLTGGSQKAQKCSVQHCGSYRSWEMKLSVGQPSPGVWLSYTIFTCLGQADNLFFWTLNTTSDIILLWFSNFLSCATDQGLTNGVQQYNAMEAYSSLRKNRTLVFLRLLCKYVFQKDHASYTRLRNYLCKLFQKDFNFLINWYSDAE